MSPVVSALPPTWHMMPSGPLLWGLTGIPRMHACYTCHALLAFILITNNCRALPTIENDLVDFRYGVNGRHVTDSIMAKLNRSDFSFIGVSVSESNAIIILRGLMLYNFREKSGLMQMVLVFLPQQRYSSTETAMTQQLQVRRFTN